MMTGRQVRQLRWTSLGSTNLRGYMVGIGALRAASLPGSGDADVGALFGRPEDPGKDDLG